MPMIKQHTKHADCSANMTVARLVFVLLALLGCNSTLANYQAPYTASAPSIDGKIDAKLWDKAPWLAIDKPIIGPLPAANDFSGKMRAIWDEQHLYLQVLITDDVIFDQYADPLHRYWDDDCLELFIDEDNSGGLHQYNFNAFAYHVAIDNQVVDFGPASQIESSSSKPTGGPMLLNHHLDSQWQRSAVAPHQIVWELAVKVYSDQYQVEDTRSQQHARVTLSADKVMGFMLAYCDNDGSESREHFVGTHDITPQNGDKNLGYITADVFGKLTLVK
ncbi:CBM9 family sugar-binding protein [Shewanella sp. Scap07]|uniref:CBM9 family sugar-binding protein n=1 Tax=Shewanella sp. Scap07 TaxID=2589987 RepID=UPI002117CC56|nr:CBM9 family sugar-binding protein [Shewanella sp. Scap07]